MSLLKLIVSIVPHDKGERLTRAAVNAGCGGGSVVMGRGLAKSNLAAILGFGESTKDIIYMKVEDTKKEQIREAIKKSTSNEKKDFGELFTLNVESMLKSNVVFQGEEMMKYLLDEFEQKPSEIWASNMFGKSLHDLVKEQLQSKLYTMPEEIRVKIQKTLQKIINEGSMNIITILL